MYLGHTVPVGNLNVDFSAAGDDDRDAIFGITLYFQTATSGVYKSHEGGDGFSETTWGLFTIGAN